MNYRAQNRPEKFRGFRETHARSFKFGRIFLPRMWSFVRTIVKEDLFSHIFIHGHVIRFVIENLSLTICLHAWGLTCDICKFFQTALAVWLQAALIYRISNNTCWSIISVVNQTVMVTGIAMVRAHLMVLKWLQFSLKLKCFYITPSW